MAGPAERTSSLVLYYRQVPDAFEPQGFGGFMGYRRFRRPPLLGKRRTALVARFLTILKIFEICQKSIFGHFWGSLDTQGFRKCQFFCVLVDLGFLENFDFFGFLGGLEILAGGSGAVLVGVSRM